ncbi:MAG TPA: DUF481 domain-containing protein [Vicinamibacterales bacterium]|nr:DUF481 domain-containing protein [Vicinamibacterales bacterium]HOQ60503.1 DUF481 domain-containing protein [Vicinamibacterales bacterium]HPK70647.1 DUF481 domain-containing protein [Vicinamibacterales bacterium]
MRQSVVAIALAALCVPLPASAEPADPPPPPRHEGTAELSYVGTSGNSSTQTIGLGGEFICRPDQWVITNKAAFVRNKSESELTAETYVYLFKAARTISSRLAGFGQYDYFRDEFAGMLHRHSLLGGVQYKIVELSEHLVTADGGLGYVNEQRIAGADLSLASWSAGAAYRWKISETAEFTDDVQLLGLFSERGGWRLKQSASVTARLTELLSLKVANTIRYVSQPVPGFKSTDTMTSIALVAKF